MKKLIPVIKKLSEQIYPLDKDEKSKSKTA